MSLILSTIRTGRWSDVCHSHLSGLSSLCFCCFVAEKRLMTFVCCTCRINPHSHVKDHRSVSHVLHQGFVTVEARVRVFFPSRRQKMWLGWPRLVFHNWRGRVTAIWIKETGWISLFSCTVKVPFTSLCSSSVSWLQPILRPESTERLSSWLWKRSAC